MMPTGAEVNPELTPKRRSAFSVWLHPRRSRRELDALDEELRSLRAGCEQAESDRRTLQQNLEEMTMRTTHLSSRLAEEMEEKNRKVAELEGECSQLNSELAEWRRTRMELDSIARQMKEWEGVKAKYEERIRLLRLRLNEAMGRNATAASGGDDSEILDSGESPYIDMRGPVRRRRRSAGADDSDWLIELPPE